MKAGKGVILSFVERGFCFTLLSVPFSNELSGCEIMRMWLTKGDNRLWRLNMRTMLLFSCQKWMENTSINSYCPTTRWGTHRARACPCGDCCSVQMKNKTFYHLTLCISLDLAHYLVSHCQWNTVSSTAINGRMTQWAWRWRRSIEKERLTEDAAESFFSWSTVSSLKLQMLLALRNTEAVEK